MLSTVLLIFFMACRDNKSVEEDTQGWWESDTETKTDESSEDKEDISGDEEDKELEDIEDCPEDFDPQASCEGSWETTICYYDDTIWWCQDGTWLNEDDK